MTTVAVLHRVRNFDEWKVGYDEHGAVREKLGCTGAQVLRTSGDPDNVLVLTHWPSLEAAQNFANDPSLPEVMKRAGVVSEPRIEFYEEPKS